RARLLLRHLSQRQDGRGRKNRLPSLFPESEPGRREAMRALPLLRSEGRIRFRFLPIQSTASQGAFWQRVGLGKIGAVGTDQASQFSSRRLRTKKFPRGAEGFRAQSEG